MACDHKSDNYDRGVLVDASGRSDGGGASAATADKRRTPYRDTCGKCGALRIDSQLGLESTPDAYVATLVQVFRDVKRVLRDDGTLWLNLGDSYCSTDKWGGGKSGNNGKHVVSDDGDVPSWAVRTKKEPIDGLKPKDLVGVPWRVAFALQADGWYLRSDIIWSKPNPMPESVTDRPTKAHEYLFLLTKAPRYYYDSEAIREEAEYGRRGWASREVAFGSAEGRRVKGNNAQGEDDPSAGRNKRSVWTIATQAYAEAHFATFPEALIEPCILAGTSARGQCPACGAPWVRVVEAGPSSWEARKAAGHKTSGYHAEDGAIAEHDPYRKDLRPTDIKHQGGLGWVAPKQTLGWQPSCTCDAGDPVPQLILDPFTGSGTTGAVAVRHQRSFVGVELNPAYLELARRRIGDVAPLLAREVA